MKTNSASNNVYACDLCEYSTPTEHSLNVHKGHKHKPASSTPEKERTSFFQRDISLTMAPTKKIRVEKCGNYGLEMTPKHQCQILTAEGEVSQESQKEELRCEMCKITFVTNAHFKEHIESNHTLGPACGGFMQSLLGTPYPESCREEPGNCHLFKPKCGLKKYRTISEA